VRAMVLDKPGTPLTLREVPLPQPTASEVLVHIEACGVCRTDLHVVDGELTHPTLPLIPGHEVVGEVVQLGRDAKLLEIGQRVGVPWLGSTCGHCQFCQRQRENLCQDALFTGYTKNGGYAEYVTADEHYAFPVDERGAAASLAPLLCAGLIGYRSLRMAGDAQHLGLYGFGAAAHIVAQLALQQGRTVSAFTRPGDEAAQRFARGLGVHWAGGSDERPGRELDAAILFAPVGALVPAALAATVPGGTVVCAGIHMSDIPSFPYELLWGERILRSVANLTRQDGLEFFRLLKQFPVHTSVKEYPLTSANEALDTLRSGDVSGALVLVP
jgi:alcohol dehydrogenase, propanol-preferring